MNTIIKKGVSIIQMPPQEQRKNKKTGVMGSWIVNDKIKVEICFEGKKYHLGTYERAEDAKKIRETAEEKKEYGTFPEWYASNFEPRKGNKFGVTGLFHRPKIDNYTLRINYKGHKYNITKIKTIEEAAIIRAEADRHIEDGTFIEWFEDRKLK